MRGKKYTLEILTSDKEYFEEFSKLCDKKPEEMTKEEIDLLKVQQENFKFEDILTTYLKDISTDPKWQEFVLFFNKDHYASDDIPYLCRKYLFSVINNAANDLTWYRLYEGIISNFSLKTRKLCCNEINFLHFCTLCQLNVIVRHVYNRIYQVAETSFRLCDLMRIPTHPPFQPLWGLKKIDNRRKSISIEHFYLPFHHEYARCGNSSIEECKTWFNMWIQNVYVIKTRREEKSVSSPA